LVAVVSAPQTIPENSDSSGEDVPSDGSSPTTSTPALVVGARSGTGVASAVVRMDVGLVIEKLGSKYSIVATSPLRNSSVIIKATAKGKPTITWSAKTNVNAQKIIMSTRSLKGYTISLWVNGRKLSSIKAG
jgi:hypothetical protein